MGRFPIDHIVYAVPDLDRAMIDFKELTGIPPVIGGKHEALGTMNALVNLGNGVYLELFAIDPSSDVDTAHWMGIDEIQESRITRWAIKTNTIEKDAMILGQYSNEMGNVHRGQRRLETGDILEWSLTMPLATPMIEVVPFLIDWQASSHHPTDRLPQGCVLNSIMFHHPQPLSLNTVMSSFGYADLITQYDDPSIIIEIDTPKGAVTLR